MNTFRFAYVTKKGVQSLMNRIPEFALHAGLTLEGRCDEELPERSICCVRVKGLDMVNMSVPCPEPEA